MNQMNLSGVGQCRIPAERKLTPTQANRLYKAMGQESFTRWFDAYRRGQTEETVVEMIGALDAMGEEVFREWICIEISSRSGAIDNVAAPSPNNETSGVPIPSSPNVRLAIEDNAGAAKMDLLDRLQLAGAIPDSMSEFSEMLKRGTPPVAAPAQRLQPAQHPTAAKEGGNIGDAEIAAKMEWLDRNQLACGIPDSLTEFSEMIKRGQLGVANPIHFSPSEAGASLSGAGALERLPAIPATDPTISKCAQCEELMPCDYPTRRSHVYDNHPPEATTTELDTQKALEEAMGACFPNEVVLNDFTCTDCGRKISIIKSRTTRELQRFHLQRYHLQSIAPEIFPLVCPVSSCAKWSPTRPDEDMLRKHTREEHRSLTAPEKEACDKRLKRLQSAAEESLADYFSHTPTGVLCVGVGNKTHYSEKTAILPARSEKRSLPQPNGGESEPSETACQKCEEAIPSTYPKRREHVVRKHIGEDEMKGSVTQQQGRLEMEMAQCFPTATILNDLMCNYAGCGRELQVMVGRTMVELRSWHVQEHHLPSATDGEEEAKIECPITGCSRTHRNLYALRLHLAQLHSGVRGLTPNEKATYKQTVDRVKKATLKLLPECFPHRPDGSLNPGTSTRHKRKAPLDEEDQQFFLNRP